MHKRYMSVWFRYFATDRMVRLHPELKDKPFLLYAPERGRMVVKASSQALTREGVMPSMVVADVRAILPSVEVYPEEPDVQEKHLADIAEYCFRYTPVVATDPSDGLILDISGCAHLWGGELPYLKAITTRFQKGGYEVRAAIADTIGTAWAVARYGRNSPIVDSGKQTEALFFLPPTALRLDSTTLERMRKLGFREIGQFIPIPRTNLRRRFGDNLLTRLGQALGTEHEMLNPIHPAPVYQERLPCLEPIRTAKGIKIALRHLLETLCERFFREGKGMRTGILKGYRIDGETVQISIGTNRASRNAAHLFKLFELKIPEIEPALGIELFTLEATLVEDVSETQEALWNTGGNNPKAIAELLDNIAGKVGMQAIHRYFPQEHYWPENSVKEVNSLEEQPETDWRTDRPRPLHLLPRPEPVEVMVVLPDYPPLHFRYRGNIIRVAKADGPERIEQEWWLQTGPPRDYYCVEGEDGARYWLFRLGLYGSEKPRWFLHGFFV
ncbi:DNA polymerase Y family protein [Mariniphaga sediminis]|uniref:DNA polymerase Y family protein n=1 Tax=Mariniphaga sediminis TaxID=1628158 RepID=A0A399CS97_9BACT|nr:DNA polymerase Y family protein [Mariniphaga sediminis]RIH62809.1 DNA polymerase Y family protein [Mariniphaga sediminis]